MVFRLEWVPDFVYNVFEEANNEEEIINDFIDLNISAEYPRRSNYPAPSEPPAAAPVLAAPVPVGSPDLRPVRQFTDAEFEKLRTIISSNHKHKVKLLLFYMHPISVVLNSFISINLLEYCSAVCCC